MTLVPLLRIGNNCCTRKYGARTLNGEKPVKVFDRGVLDRRGFGHSSIENKDIQAIADDAANPLGKRMRAVRSGEIGGNHVGATAGAANFRDDCLGLFRTATVVNNDLRSSLGKGESAGAPDAARGPGDQCRLS
jgi:hypothetical protein